MRLQQVEEKRPKPLRTNVPVRRTTTLAESSSNEEESLPQPRRTQRMSLEDVRAAGKKKREEK